ncbi:lipase [Blastococcus sp. TF02-8]|uniref:lipase family alpha/beta hydrolase n=1 Tax=Blastococcus sp. TF02-8 TaxID=2250574 RepID=UPI000DE9404F|nr:alpha/beta fold hydrolase [Blastococcus sp. TF02-8]RBY95591.1 lipase [Blastococcus sp. TF02-8]
MLAGLAPARRRVVLLLLALVVVAAAVLTVVVVRSGGAAPTAGPPAAERRPGPVLLVPGYGGDPAGMRELAARFRADGRDATVVEWPGPGTGDLRDVAEQLDVAAREALDRTDAESVDVVGYSAGGLVARIWVDGDGAELARRVVTLGSPHHGTDLAALAGGFLPSRCPVGCQQMDPGSSLLAELNDGDETPEGTDWVSIWTTQDQTVTPPESARLDGALNIPVQSVCPGAQLTHAQLPHSPLVVAMAAEELGDAPLVDLGPEDCARLGG